MKRFKMLSVFLCMAVGMLGFASTSGAVDLTLGAASTTVPEKGTFELQVNVSDAATLCGGAMTVEYDATKVDLVTTASAVIPAGSVDPAEITSAMFTMVTDSRTQDSALPMAGNNLTTATATVSLSGAYVDPTTGAGKYTGAQKMFGLKFKLKDALVKGDTVNFSLKQTSIYNPTAGWGTADDVNQTKVPVPALVGVPADWKTAEKQFIDIPATFPTSAFVVTVGDAYDFGDPTGDGYIDSDDALFILQVVAGNYDEASAKGRADVTCDGVVDSDDALEILHVVAGNKELTPCK